MLGEADTFSSYSVKDIEEAKGFYEDTLGLEVRKTEQGLEVQTGNRQHIFIYPKADHTAASFTVLNFHVDNIETAVADLAEKGVAFEQYDMDELQTDENGIARMEGRAMAWFKDPAGNILGLMES